MIPIQRESAMCSTVGGMERCCMCREPTPMWTNLPDRTAGEQVALCEVCAMQARPVMVPSKRAWLDLERARRWARNHVFDGEQFTPAWVRVQAGIVQRRGERFGIWPR